MSKTINIEIIADISCPWCIIGFKRLEAALLAMQDKVVATLNWQPFELNQSMPKGGENQLQYIKNKYSRTHKQALQKRAQLTELGKQYGFNFNYQDDMRVYNTHKAHKLLLWAKDSGRQNDLALALFTAFFTELVNIDNDKVLIEIAGRAGIDSQDVKQALANNELSKQVKVTHSYWLNTGIQSVPAYIINRQALVNGGQDQEDWVELLLQFA